MGVKCEARVSWFGVRDRVVVQTTSLFYEDMAWSLGWCLA